MGKKKYSQNDKKKEKIRASAGNKHVKKQQQNRIANFLNTVQVYFITKINIYFK